MFRLSKITITQFKNYDFSTFNFTERVIGICGLNGRGKTNLLDAIYYLCFTKSYFTKTDSLNISFTADGFRLEGITAPAVSDLKSPVDENTVAGADRNSSNSIVCVFRGLGKKELLLNGVLYTKFSEHIGKFPCVIIAPDDVEMITGGSEERRRFMDTVISQMNAEYLQQLIIYNKVLQQRNSLLKKFAEQGKTDWTLLEVLDEQLVQPGKYIYQKRTEFTLQLIPLVQQFYKQIANNTEVVDLHYESQLNDNDFFAVLNQFRQKDFILQRSNGGIHKDDLTIQLNGQVFKTTASQGQRKSLLFALKLAEFELLKLNKGFAPLLLLDDVFEKLDETRMQNLLHWVCNKNSGQVFITDTHKERLQRAFEGLQSNCQVIEL
ncbi:DNA replication and repair protein RecF [Ferruginibacter paludis]|uniref:DNA replication/repair protein RecF n=1 Tax=Ferruginibacter paludis TaxID=1310417 RepID=UPI0025B32AF6|nr:DNA replication and repair protein RecF [Ferruginibacter paludis]MDN3657575.1 DNA replication and repair protein RecF [Ferruginibacter paludis]